MGGGAIVALVVLALLLVPAVRSRLGGNLLAPSAEHIAVLPFDNIGNDPSNEPLAQGLTDSLAGKLSNLDVGGKSVSTPADIRKGLADARTDGKHTVLFRVKSTDGTKFVALPLGNA